MQTVNSEYQMETGGKDNALWSTMIVVAGSNSV